jgi:hypothetical protein
VFFSGFRVAFHLPGMTILLQKCQTLRVPRRAGGLPKGQLIPQLWAFSVGSEGFSDCHLKEWLGKPHSKASETQPSLKDRAGRSFFNTF